MGEFYPVLGAMRTGTSLVAQILHTLGVPMGADQWVEMPDVSWSPTHFWADRQFNQLHNAMLHNAEDSQLGYGMTIPNPEHLEAYQALVRKREAESPKWGLKDHWLPILWKTLAPLHRFEIRPIFTSRPMVSANASYAQRIDITTNEAAQVLRPWREAVARIQADYPEALVVPLPALIADPALWVEDIAYYAGVPMKAEAVALVKSEWCRF